MRNITNNKTNIGKIPSHPFSQVQSQSRQLSVPSVRQWVAQEVGISARCFPAVAPRFCSYSSALVWVSPWAAAPSEEYLLQHRLIHGLQPSGKQLFLQECTSIHVPPNVPSCVPTVSSCVSFWVSSHASLWTPSSYCLFLRISEQRHHVLL